MSRNGRVIVAMSGGVDSSVAACLLKDRGYECIGAFMRVGAAGSESTISPPDADAEQACASGCEAGGGAPSDAPESKAQHRTSGIQLPQRRLKHGCCSATDALDARVIAGKLGIPFYALNFEHDFGRIIDYFVDEYGRARTPNPCVMCNIHLKFGKLLKYAEMMDAEFVATGHYARTMELAPGLTGDRELWTAGAGFEPTAGAPECPFSSSGCKPNTVLARAINVAKDQSYVLFGIQRADLPRCLFPLGAFADKGEVRRVAADLGLRVHDKPDSQEICFVPNNDYTQLYDLRRPSARRPGEIRDASGQVVGTHAGYQSYTIGQRRGLKLALGRPMYVTSVDPNTNTVVIGERDGLLSPGLLVDTVNWLVDPPPRRAGEIEGGWRCSIKIRHMHIPAPGRLRALGDGVVEAEFEVPQPAVTPGQAAVFYAGNVVLGGGWIRAALGR